MAEVNLSVQEGVEELERGGRRLGPGVGGILSPATKVEIKTVISEILN